MRFNRTGLIVIAISAAFFAGSVVSMAAGHGAHSAKKKKAKAGPAGPAGPAGSAGAPGQPGAPGSAKAIIHWFDTDAGPGTLDTANTTPGASVCRDGAGEYAVTLPAGIAVKSVEVTPDVSASDSTTTPRSVDAAISGGIGACSGANFIVRTRNATNGDLEATGFFAIVN